MPAKALGGRHDPDGDANEEGGAGDDVVAEPIPMNTTIHCGNDGKGEDFCGVVMKNHAGRLRAEGHQARDGVP